MILVLGVCMQRFRFLPLNSDANGENVPRITRAGANAYNVHVEATFKAKLINALGWTGLCAIPVMVLIATGLSSDGDMRAEALQYVPAVVTNSLVDVPQPVSTQSVTPPAVTHSQNQNDQAPLRAQTLDETGLDTKATAVGEYAVVLVKRIQDKWKAELGAIESNTNASGKVVVQFNLHFDGRITDCQITESTVPPGLADKCLNAISTVAPFPRFSNEMRREVGSDTRQIQFTFYYNGRQANKAQ